jgi:hypothetical protein
MNRLLRAGAIALGLLLAAPAMAQPSTSAAVTATLVVPTVLHIEVSSSTVDFTGDFDAFEAGYAEGDEQTTISHRGNVRHSVSVAAGAATFTGSGGGGAPDPVRTDKPASDLTWSLDGTTFTPFSTTAAVVHSQAPRGAHNNDEDVSYRVALAYADDTPGTYTLGLTYTVAAD